MVDEHPQELVVGSTGKEAEFVGPYLSNSLVIWTAIADISLAANPQS